MAQLIVNPHDSDRNPTPVEAAEAVLEQMFGYFDLTKPCFPAEDPLPQAA